MRRSPAGVAAVVGALALGAVAGGCLDPAGAARGDCAAQGVGEHRCRAIVADAGQRLGNGRGPITGVVVRMAGPEDRTTLRFQQLVALVRFSFLDGSVEEVPVFCTGAPGRSLVCAEPST